MSVHLLLYTIYYFLVKGMTFPFNKNVLFIKQSFKFVFVHNLAFC